MYDLKTLFFVYFYDRWELQFSLFLSNHKTTVPVHMHTVLEMVRTTETSLLKRGKDYHQIIKAIANELGTLKLSNRKRRLHPSLASIFTVKLQPKYKCKNPEKKNQNNFFSPVK